MVCADHFGWERSKQISNLDRSFPQIQEHLGRLEGANAHPLQSAGTTGAGPRDGTAESMDLMKISSGYSPDSSPFMVSRYHRNRNHRNCFPLRLERRSRSSATETGLHFFSRVAIVRGCCAMENGPNAKMGENGENVENSPRPKMGKKWLENSEQKLHIFHFSIFFSHFFPIFSWGEFPSFAPIFPIFSVRPVCHCVKQLRTIAIQEALRCKKKFSPKGTVRAKIRGSQKGGFQKGGFGGCSPVPKTGTRVHLDDIVPLVRITETRVHSDVPRYRKPERGYIRQNHPFSKRPFRFLSTKTGTARAVPRPNHNRTALAWPLAFPASLALPERLKATRVSTSNTWTTTPDKETPFQTSLSLGDRIPSALRMNLAGAC